MRALVVTSPGVAEPPAGDLNDKSTTDNRRHVSTPEEK